MDHFSVRDHRNYAWRCQHGVVQQSDSIQFFVQGRTTIKTHVVRSLPVVLAEWTLKAANHTFSSMGCGFESHERFLSKMHRKTPASISGEMNRCVGQEGVHPSRKSA
jgi:hypothetical protein